MKFSWRISSHDTCFHYYESFILRLNRLLLWPRVLPTCGCKGRRPSRTVDRILWVESRVQFPIEFCHFFCEFCQVLRVHGLRVFWSRCETPKNSKYGRSNWQQLQQKGGYHQLNSINIYSLLSTLGCVFWFVVGAFGCEDWFQNDDNALMQKLCLCVLLLLGFLYARKAHPVRIGEYGELRIFCVAV